jgi:hypothetical protein
MPDDLFKIWENKFEDRRSTLLVMHVFRVTFTGPVFLRVGGRDIDGGRSAGEGRDDGIGGLHAIDGGNLSSISCVYYVDCSIS